MRATKKHFIFGGENCFGRGVSANMSDGRRFGIYDRRKRLNVEREVHSDKRDVKKSESSARDYLNCLERPVLCC